MPQPLPSQVKESALFEWIGRKDFENAILRNQVQQLSVTIEELQKKIILQ